MKKRVGFILFLSVLILIAACTPSPKEEIKEKQSEKIYLERTWMEALSGETLTLKDFKGKVVVIDFWATWCQPCIASIPFYIKMYDKYSDDGLTIIGINVNETSDEINSFASRIGLNYTVAFFNDDLNSIYKVTGIPTIFIFDKNGDKVANFVGYSPESEAKIEDILKTELSK